MMPVRVIPLMVGCLIVVAGKVISEAEDVLVNEPTVGLTSVDSESVEKVSADGDEVVT